LHILIIDDDPALSEMLTEYLAGEGIRTSTAFNGTDGVSAALSGQFDAIVLDIMLPGMDGNDVLRRIRQTSTVPIIMLTAKGGDVDRVVGLELGADDYVAKPYFPRELVARLRAVTRRHTGSQAPAAGTNTVLKLGPLQLTPGKREVLWRGAPVELTSSEFEMLENLMLSGELVATKEELSLKVLGRAREAYDRGVDVHVGNLRRKLTGYSAGVIEIETVRGVGYRLRLQS
jgi:two-component system, OmpR family, response regulator